MTENDIEIKNCNEFLKTKDNIPYDTEQIENAKKWYYNFTGKPYNNDDLKELVEIYKVICKNS